MATVAEARMHVVAMMGAPVLTINEVHARLEADGVAVEWLQP